MAEEPKEESSYYRPLNLHVWFLVSSLLLLASVVLMIWDGYAGPYQEWKRYQREFLAMERARQARGIEAQEKEIPDLPGVRALERGLEDYARKAEDVRKAEAEAGALEDDFTSQDQAAKIRKSIQDSRRFFLEEARKEREERRIPDAEYARLLAEYEEGEREYLRLSDIAKRTGERLAAVEKRIEGLRAGARDLAASAPRLGIGPEEVGRKEAELRALAELEKLRKQARALSPTGLEGFIRDQNPFTDFVKPSVRVRDPLVLPKLRENYNFIWVAKNDRCYNCHVGIDRPEYAGEANPHRTHPRLSLFVADGSRHPMKEFGCTVCHGGNPQGLTFQLAYHTPRDAAQAGHWKEKYGWSPPLYWDYPQVPVDRIESSCQRCHASIHEIAPAAPKLARGVETIRRLGCYGCHDIRGFEGLPRAGPSLVHIAAKTTPDWTVRWVEHPKGFRPLTTMPRFWFLSNTRSPGDKARGAVEIESVVSLLFERSEPLPASPPAEEAVAQTALRAASRDRGKAVFESVGCLGCHTMGPADAYGVDALPPGQGRTFGPDLSRVHEKTNPRWLYEWIRNPSAISPNTRMPNLRLSEREAADVAAYLMDPKVPAPTAPPRRPWAEADLRRGAEEAIFDLKTLLQGAAPGESPEEADSLRRVEGRIAKADPLRMPEEEMKALIRLGIAADLLAQEKSVRIAVAEAERRGEEGRRRLLGEKALSRYGCFGCHLIRGYEDRKGIGAPLPEIADKMLEKFDFGNLGIEEEKPVPEGVPQEATTAAALADPTVVPARVGVGIVRRTRQDWIAQKLRDPRSFDHLKTKAWEDRLRMPNFLLSEEEIDAVTTVLVGQKGDNVEPVRIYGNPSQRQALVRQGRAQVASGVHPDYHYVPTDDMRAIVEGRALALSFNCRGCHILEDQGGAIRPTIAAVESGKPGNRALKQTLRKLYAPDPKDREQDPDARRRLIEQLGLNVYGRLAPPDLAGEGSKVRPEWLYRFLREPFVIRPILRVRMPTFNFGRGVPLPTGADDPSVSEADLAKRVKALRDEILALAREPSPGPEERWLAEAKAGKVDERSALEAIAKGVPRAELRARVAALSRERHALEQARDMETIARYFAALDREAYPFPLEEPKRPSREGLEAARRIMEKVNCQSCHTIGEPREAVQTDSPGPDLAAVGARLRPGWTLRWLDAPQAIVPGTPMVEPIPREMTGEEREKFYAHVLGGDRGRQLEALRDYLLTTIHEEVPRWREFRKRAAGEAKKPPPAKAP